MESLYRADERMSQETLKINTLVEICKALTSSLDVQAVFADVMNILAFRLAMKRGALILRDSEAKELNTKVVYGGFERQMKEGDIHKKVFESGIPIAVFSPDGTPSFLDDSKSLDIEKQNISYFCVPIMLENRVVGVLAADRLFDNNVAFDEDLSLLKSITSIIAQIIKFYHISKEKRGNLAIENKHLRNELEGVKRLLGNNGDGVKTTSQAQISVEGVLEKKLAEIITVMDGMSEGKRRLYADVISKVEKALFKLALDRTKNVKYEAARFLGINRNTLHKKMKNLNLSV